ncbi:Glyoxalase/Bleomycin resistance protein/Dihydroxybiphenyl dioxygenase [Penicillium atrosanguineum]|uniref:Glyoxalase/Bleomycin resistance protein/Dihydroxybiphenyl dioxygenase n=1 Tax=Penicillium atrosanguineum TaxID=1132637 RepID=A0A9W9H7W4_9EURO|nr:sugar phosphate/phosphate translocator [Penicillium atrosanguineum]KAJ5122550.1 Glyoxalase/Bleomycin resistance protein/Dihydroxybiphenyl dioxygenase [Penicillium atrosanguineum]KAJ5140274.1 Glyoxalase/Bleomycin resistance protein/Dihydroxybiphenyl dioxygenase [Penicillium atrosanguineum]KAJ5310191.1 sugar phosphate/phosphate translocator [Penicillium atrosanguineum]KAJ5315707.1 Glyoxalase/Bleomycin resistance protein/Dihydroxybiphenyl dioxygenase [Penicillium atrosanguineum]
MQFYTFFQCFIAFGSIHYAQACTPRSDSGSTDNPFVFGNDGPAPAATLGFAINHFGLLTTNLDAMKQFYGDILGMRLIFDAHVTPEFTVTYMGYAQGGRNGTGFQSGAELARDKNNLYGLIEMVQFNVSDDHFEPSTKRTNTFGHVGLIVPDVEKAQSYLEAKGVAILKRVKEPITEFTGPIQNAFGIGEFAGEHIAAKKALVAAQGLIGLEMFLIIEDPDGNLVEIQQQEAPSA